MARVPDSTLQLDNSLKTVFCTYCSADKVEGKDLLPAIARYQSRRIVAVHKAAGQVLCDFFIFSGKFGLLKPEEKIPFYDHLMVDGEVEAMVAKVASQLKEIMKVTGIKSLVFFSHSLDNDPQLGPYQRCIQEAGVIAQCLVLIVELPESIVD